jgi:hypothetical protein
MDAGFLIIILLSYLGLLAGCIISHFAPEEIAPGKRYFRVLKSMIFFLIFALFMMHLRIHYVIAFPVSAAIAYCMFRWEIYVKFVSQDILVYAFFAVVTYETRAEVPVYPVLVFIYGIIAASMKFDEKPGTFFVRSAAILSEGIIYLLLSFAFILAFRA